MIFSPNSPKPIEQMSLEELLEAEKEIVLDIRDSWGLDDEATERLQKAREKISRRIVELLQPGT